MSVRVHIYLEPAEDSVVWWAESPDVAGFYAADDDLQGLLVNAEAALREQLGEALAEAQGGVSWELVGQPPQEASDVEPRPDRGSHYVVVTSAPRGAVPA